MAAVEVPVTLSERLGEPATAALIQMFENERHARTEVIVQQCTDRFERRLVEETSRLRGEVGELRADMAEFRSEIRGDVSQVRTEFGQLRTGFSELRTDVRVEISGLRTEMATQRFELLKWMFVFWVGQLVSVVGFVGLMFRMRP